MPGLAEVLVLDSVVPNADDVDVLNAEPPDDPELMRLPNVIATPHAAFYSRESFVECRRSSAMIVKRFFDEGIIMNLVNEEYLETK